VTMSSRHKLTAQREPGTMSVLFLLDGGPQIGFGHVGRCLALWEELGDYAAFAIADPTVIRLLRKRGVRVSAPGSPARVVLVDRQAPTAAEAIGPLQAGGSRVCLLDDSGTARASADLVIDPPTARSWPPASGRRLAGFEHVLLRRDVRAAAQRPRPVVEVLLSMGGSDPEGLTPALAHALQAAGASVLSVLGPGYRGLAPEGTVLERPEDWPAALAGARLLVGRFGHTLLEAAHLGTPALAVATSAQASADAEAFAAHGTSDAIHVQGPDDASAVAERAVALLADAPHLAALAARGRELIDGLGAARVAAALRGLT
jgi:UDP-2,4-diacetamido-2,4,6-trideoxy-beta-L-altropyranose hydrolase